MIPAAALILPVPKPKERPTKKSHRPLEEIVNEQAKAKAAKAAAEKKAAADAGKAKAKGAKASLFKDVEFGGQLCLQVGIPLKPFCSGESKRWCRHSLLERGHGQPCSTVAGGTRAGVHGDWHSSTRLVRSTAASVSTSRERFRTALVVLRHDTVRCLARVLPFQAQSPRVTACQSSTSHSNAVSRAPRVTPSRSLHRDVRHPRLAGQGR